MRRTDLMDTKEWAHREMVLRLRAMSPAERLRIVFDRSKTSREIDRLAKDRIRARRENDDGR